MSSFSGKPLSLFSLADHIYSDLPHSADLAEIEDLEQFLEEVLPPEEMSAGL